MGVMLRGPEDPMPTEEELARLAGLVPGDVDRKKLEELGLVDFTRNEAGDTREFLFGRVPVLRTAEHHSHSSAPFFHA